MVSPVGNLQESSFFGQRYRSLQARQYLIRRLVGQDAQRRQRIRLYAHRALAFGHLQGLATEWYCLVSLAVKQIGATCFVHQACKVSALWCSGDGIQSLQAEGQAPRRVVHVPGRAGRLSVQSGYAIQIPQALVQLDPRAPGVEGLLESALPVQCFPQA